MIITIILIAIVEVILLATWNKTYFQIGIPLYRRQIKRTTFNPAPAAETIESALPDTRWVELTVHALDKNTLAFREKLRDRRLFRFRISYTPLMHGLLQFDLSGGEINVTGYANWFPIAVALLFLALPWTLMRDFGEWEMFNVMFFLAPLFILLLYGSIYFIQRGRFNELAEVAADAWERAET